GLFVSLGLMLARWGERGWHWLWMVGLGFLGLALLLTGSRGALLLGIPAGVAFCLVCQPAFYRRLRLRPWLVAVLLAAGLLAGGLLLGERLLNSDTVAQRLHIWQGALDLWRAYPWLGVGPGGFFWHYPAFMTAAAASEPNLLHPHLLWLEFATGWGVAGLLWVLAFGYWLVSRVTDRRTQLGGLEMGLLAGLVAGIAHGQVDAFGALPELAAWNWLVIALLSTQVRQNRKIADKSIQ
ncbi:MAG: O-antigen ligase family protein, partial [Caldilineaceae bacterium]